jgi:hypothetical protein
VAVCTANLSVLPRGKLGVRWCALSVTHQRYEGGPCAQRSGTIGATACRGLAPLQQAALNSVENIVGAQLIACLQLVVQATSSREVANW